MNPIEKKKQLSNAHKQKLCELAKKIKNLNKKYIVDKIHKLIVKAFKLNVNHHIKTSRNHNLFQVY
jgi:hypothetical protein